MKTFRKFCCLPLNYWKKTKELKRRKQIDKNDEELLTSYENKKMLTLMFGETCLRIRKNIKLL